MPDNYGRAFIGNKQPQRSGISSYTNRFESGGPFTTLWKRFTGQLALEQNMAMADYMYSKDLDMWNVQNQYNSPVEQMNRLQEAGLNPKLIYGSGVAGATGMAKEMPKYQAPRADFNSVLGELNPLRILSAYQDIKLKNAQVDLVRANTEKSKEQTISETIKQGIYTLESQLKGIDLDFNKSTFDQRRKNIELLNQEVNQRTNNLMKDFTIKEQMLLKEMEYVIQEELKTNMRKFGLTDNDPFWARLLAQGAFNQGWSAAELHSYLKQQGPTIAKSKDFWNIVKLFYPGTRFLPGLGNFEIPFLNNK